MVIILSDFFDEEINYNFDVEIVSMTSTIYKILICLRIRFLQILIVSKICL